jgi:Heterokaryon incompatibility protein (HET)
VPQIYRNAKYVQCWLGESSPDSDVALTIFQNMAVENCHLDVVDMEDTWAGIWMDERMAKMRSLRARFLKGLDSVAAEIPEFMDAEVAVSMPAANLRDVVGEKTMIAIRNLLQRPWWCRVRRASWV